jgi:hypothetical protein
MTHVMTKPSRQTAVNQKGAHRYRPVRLRPACLAGVVAYAHITLTGSSFPIFADLLRHDVKLNAARCLNSDGILHAAKSILVIGGGSCFSSILPSRLIFANSQLSSAPTSMVKPVQ